MATNNVSNLAGLFDTIAAEAIFGFKTTAVTPNAVWNMEAPAGALAVNFPTWASAYRVAKTSSHTEGGTITGSAMPFTSTLATLAEYADFSPVSMLASKANPESVMYTARGLGQKLANTVDYQIALLASGVTTNAITNSTDGLSLDDLMYAIGAIKSKGFEGRLTAILHPQQYYGSYGLASNLLGTAHPQTSPTQQSLLGVGWVNNIAGVDIYVTSQVLTASGGSNAWGMVLAEEALGFAYSAPLINVMTALNPATHTEDVGVGAYFSAVRINEPGICLLDTKIV